MEWVFDGTIWISLTTLTALELVLGVDNVIFISILSGKLPVAERQRARRMGLALALLTRILLLLSIAWLVRLTAPLFDVLGRPISGRDLVLLLGGLFLIAKSTFEIHDKLEGTESAVSAAAHPSFRAVVAQIVLLDIVFSLDSVITAVGMVRQIPVMVAAVMISIAVMMAFAGAIGDFVEGHPTVKMLALSFLLLIGMVLIGDGLGVHVPRGYVYFAMGFSVMVEMLNLRLRRAAAPIKLHRPVVEHRPTPRQ